MKKLILAALACAMTCGSAQAATIYTNAASGPYFGWNSSNPSGDPSQTITYDDFILSSTAASSYTVNGVTWAGYYYDDDSGKFLSGVGGSQNFTLQFSDADGHRISRGVTVTSSGSGTRLTYSASFKAFDLQAGTLYYLTVFANNVSKASNWSWEGRGTSGTAFQQFYPYVDGNYTDGGWNKLNTEQTFSLLGDANPPVPEPATWAMLITGFGLVGTAMRRRKMTVSFA